VTEAQSPYAISQWMKWFAQVYKDVDQCRSTEDLWMATMAHCSELGEGIRRVNYPDILKSAAHAFCWMCSFVNRCNTGGDLLFSLHNSLCEMVYLKFPERCGHCMSNPCQCDPSKMDAKKDKAAKYEDLLQKWLRKAGNYGLTLTQWTQLFKDVFSGRIHLATLESIGFHFLEEAGEEASAVRQLVQFRGILDAQIEGVDKGFLEALTSINTLVPEYAVCMRDEKVYNPEKPSEPKVDLTSSDPAHVKARIVRAKMDLVIEFADMFSWFCAVLVKLEQIAQSSKLRSDGAGLDIEESLKMVYAYDKGNPLLCPSCHNPECKCLFFLPKASENNANE